MAGKDGSSATLPVLNSGRRGQVWKMAPTRRSTRETPATTTILTITVTDAQLQALIDRGFAAALAERDADRSRNDDNSNDSVTSGKRQVTTQ
nr:hypothetical protein [Tanacetum cinerariifolium]